MKELFSLENPVWMFMGKIVDMIILSGLWLLGCLPIVTAGASTAALYYVMLKLVKDQEGYVVASFFKAYKDNLKQGVIAGLIAGLLFIIIGMDIYLTIHMNHAYSTALLWVFVVGAVIYMITVVHLFPLMARCETDLKHLTAMAFVIGMKNFGWSLFMIVIVICLLAAGLFLFAPLIVVAIGGSAYIHALILNRMWRVYGLELCNENEEV